MTTPRQGRRRELGRPKWSLRDDPDRYRIAYFMARQMAFPVKSPTALARVIMQAHHCEIGSRDDALALASALLEGRAINLQPKTYERKGHGDPDAKSWRDQDSANAWAADFMKKYRRAEDRLMPNPSAVDAAAADPTSDLSWLIRMVNAWFIIHRPDSHPDPLAAARHFAAAAGEADYFETEMKPYFFRVFKLNSQ